MVGTAGEASVGRQKRCKERDRAAYRTCGPLRHDRLLVALGLEAVEFIILFPVSNRLVTRSLDLAVVNHNKATAYNGLHVL